MPHKSSEDAFEALTKTLHGTMKETNQDDLESTLKKLNKQQSKTLKEIQVFKEKINTVENQDWRSRIYNKN